MTASKYILRKVFSFCTLGLLFGSTFVHAEDINVSARVSVANNKPELVSITPGYSPVVLGQNSVQSFSLQIRDIEGDSLSYTITPDYGATSPISGTITDTTKLQNAEAFINFTYLSSSDISEIGASKITITLNDGVNPVVIKEIDVYIF
ncbi:MAG: hypothetical protein GY828_05775 [Candidatus Gracilibacteria bacterium]|nr:hypothetical protein [Candidatus Gracilibacteria bacterium]